MDAPTRYLSDYVKGKGINVSNMSRRTNIPYMALYDSLLNKGSDRDLRAGEFVKICKFLGLNPMSLENAESLRT